MYHPKDSVSQPDTLLPIAAVDQTRSTEALAAAFAHAPVGFALVDRTFCYLEVNAKLAEYHGFPIEAHLGRRARDLFPEIAERWETYWQQVFDTGQPVLDLELNSVYRRRLSYWQVSYYPVRSADGSVIAVGNLVRKVTAQRRAALVNELLAEATDLFANAADQQATVRAATWLAVPRLADMAVAYLLAPDGSLAHTEVAHQDPQKAATFAALVQAMPPSATEGTLSQALRTGQSVLVIGQDLAASTNRLTPASQLLVDAMTPRSIMTVALRADAHAPILGALQFIVTEHERDFDADELRLAETIAQRCAIAIANAQLFAAAERARAHAERAARLTARLQQVTAALVAPLTPDAIAETINTAGCSAFDAQAGFVALAEPDGEHYVIAHALGHRPEQIERWRRFATSALLPASDAVRSGTPVLIEDSQDLLERYPQLAANRWSEFEARAAIPLAVAGRVLGVMLLSFTNVRSFSTDDLALMVTLGQQAAQALERARLYEREQQDLQRQRVLADASRTLTNSLDFSEMLGSVAHLVVPELADLCTVHIVGDDGRIRQLAVAHRAPHMVSLVTDLDQRYPLDPASLYGLPEVIRSRVPFFSPNVPPDLIKLFAQDAEHGALLDALSLESYLCLPLVARDRTLGALSLFMAGSGRHYTRADLLFAEELANRCALALDNARLYSAAQDAIAVRDSFLSIASHELRTPLTSLLGQAQLLQRRMQRDDGTPERDVRAVQTVINQAQRLNRMIMDLLDLSRLTGGQLSIVREPLDFASLVQRVVDELQPLQIRHVLRLDLRHQPLPVLGDAARLEQVLVNLISNAVKYSPDASEVRVVADQRGEHVVMSVSDDGIGIPASAAVHLFERFYRAENAEAQRISGVGIGLYVVREIVHRHGGTVEFYSVEGRGSTFTVVLPQER